MFLLACVMAYSRILVQMHKTAGQDANQTIVKKPEKLSKTKKTKKHG